MIEIEPRHGQWPSEGPDPKEDLLASIQQEAAHVEEERGLLETLPGPTAGDRGSAATTKDREEHHSYRQTSFDGN